MTTLKNIDSKYTVHTRMATILHSNRQHQKVLIIFKKGRFFEVIKKEQMNPVLPRTASREKMKVSPPPPDLCEILT